MTATSSKPLTQGFEFYSSTEIIDLTLLWVPKELSASILDVWVSYKWNNTVTLPPYSSTCAAYTEKEPFPCLLLCLCSA